MTDIFTKQERSAIMKNVKSRGNKSTEQRLIEIFWQKKITGWRRSYPVYGKPDFVFREKKIALFADGCFWHGHYCRNIVPKQNSDYWNKKRQRNVDRDTKISALFEQRGWTVLRFWECDIKRASIDLNILMG